LTEESHLSLIKTHMKFNAGIFVYAVLIVAVFTGCYSTPDGLRKRFGVPLVRDRWVSAYERSAEQVREAAIRVLENMGQLTLNDYINNSIEARVDTKFVSIQIVPLESGLTQIITQVRSKSGIPDTNLAREIDKQIALQLPRFRTPVTPGAGAAAPMRYQGNPANTTTYPIYSGPAAGTTTSSGGYSTRYGSGAPTTYRSSPAPGSGTYNTQPIYPPSR
jgi:hypothetical protein